MYFNITILTKKKACLLLTLRSKFIIGILLTLVNVETSAQKIYSLSDLFSENTITWYGIDYSKTSFVGNFEGKDLREYFYGWNRLFIEESKKYNISRALRKVTVANDISSVEKINWQTIPNISYTDSTLSKAEIAYMVAKYEGTQKEGLGLVLIAECYNRKKNEGSHYAVIFDIVSKKVLISQRFISPPGGLGLRNFWGFSIYNTINMLSDSYPKWKMKYGR